MDLQKKEWKVETENGGDIQKRNGGKRGGLSCGDMTSSANVA
jgi:hypothetical protein